MKGIKIILLISLLALLSCNGDSFWQDNYERVKNNAGNLRDNIANKLREYREYEVQSKFENFKKNAQKAMEDIYAKLTNNAEVAKNKIEAYTQEKLAQLQVLRDQLVAKALQSYEDVKNSELLQSTLKQINDEYELRSKQVIEFGLEKKDEVFEYLSKKLFKANDKLDAAVKKQEEAAFYELN